MLSLEIIFLSFVDEILQIKATCLTLIIDKSKQKYLKYCDQTPLSQWELYLDNVTQSAVTLTTWSIRKRIKKCNKQVDQHSKVDGDLLP